MRNIMLGSDVEVCGDNVGRVKCPSCAAHVARIRELEDAMPSEQYLRWIEEEKGPLQSRLALLEKAAEAARKRVYDDHAYKIKRAWEANTGLGHPCECEVCAALAALKEGK